MIEAILFLVVIWLIPILIIIGIKIWYNSLEEYDIDEVFYYLSKGEEPDVKKNKKRRKDGNKI